MLETRWTGIIKIKILKNEKYIRVYFNKNMWQNVVDLSKIYNINNIINQVSTSYVRERRHINASYYNKKYSRRRRGLV